MTTINTPKPVSSASPPQPRPTAMPSGAIGVPALDPIKLIQRYKWLLAAAAVVGAVLGVAAHIVLREVAPVNTADMYLSVEPQQTEMGTIGAPAMFREELMNFMNTQIQVINSDRIVSATVNNPVIAREAEKFVARFTENGALNTIEATRALKRRLSASIVPETRFIRVTLWDWDASTATALLRLVSETYMKEREDQAGRDARNRARNIETAINEQNRRIENLTNRRRTLLQEQRVETLEGNQTEAQMRQRDLAAQINNLALQRQMLESRIAQMEEQLASPAGITYADTIRQRVQDRPEMIRLTQDLQAITVELARLRQAYGPNHRSVLDMAKRLEGQRQTIEAERQRMLREEFDSTLDEFRTSVKGNRSAEAELMTRLEDARAKAEQLTRTLAEVKDINREIDTIRDSIGRLQDELGRLDVLTGQGRESRVTIFQPAQPPKRLTFPQLVMMLPLGVFLTVGLTGGIVLLRELLDQRVKSPADVGLIPRTRVLGLIPHAAEDPAAPQRIETVFRDQPRGVLAESFRQVRSSLAKHMQQGEFKSLLVLSGMPGSGATTVAVNLALAFAAAEQRVLLVDANLRRPNIHKVLGRAESPGLADVLGGSCTLADAVQSTDTEGLSVLTAGSPSARIYERLASSAMSELLAGAGQSYDIVVIDVAPAMVAGDALSLATRCDASLLVVRALGEKRGMVARLRNDLSECRAAFQGVLVNAVRASAGGYLKGNILATHAYQDAKPKP